MVKREFTFHNARKLRRSFDNDYRYLINIKNYPLTLKEEINFSLDKCKRIETEKILRKTRVEQLPNIGSSRASILQMNGYRHVSDLLGVGNYELTRLYGIGNRTAEKIIDAVKTIHRKAYLDAKVRFSYDDKQRHTTELLLLLYRYFAYEKIIESIRQFEEDFEDQVPISRKGLKRCENALLWLISKKETKENANECYRKLLNLREADTHYSNERSILFNAFAQILRSGAVEAWNDYKISPIKYNSFLESKSILDSSTIANIKQSDYIDKPLLENIDRQSLDLDGLKCQLRRYQTWGVRYIVHQKRVLLGDEMGLGKTVEAIASMVHIRNNGGKHFLVICPAGVLINWTREVYKHSDLDPIQIYGYWYQQLRHWLKNGGVAITTYGMLKHITLPDDFKIDGIVVDEAHYIKNLASQRSVYTTKLIASSKNALLMTGTALENKVGEMINIIGVLNPSVAARVRGLADHGRIIEYRREVASVYCRRKREEVLDELPQLIEETDWCKMLPLEREHYEESILQRNYSLARRLSWDMEDLSLSSKASRLKEIIEEAESEERKVLVFSFFLDTLEAVKRLTGDIGYGIIRGSVPSSQRQAMIDEFEKAPAGSVLISQIEAGGTGLNIQAASVVVICEPQFKPSTENQAISRSYRMGQARNVIVHHLLCEDTIDERLLAILQRKQAIFDNYAEKSVANEMINKLDREIGNAFQEEFEKIAKTSSTTDRTKQSNHEYYEGLLNMPYQNIVNTLLEKYGQVKGDYFIDETCRSKNSTISRAREGLECHHIDEYRAINLSNPEAARIFPYAYQKSTRLVYCNYLEHLLLHIKIAEENDTDTQSDSLLTGIGGAVEFIVKNLNDFYSGKVYQAEHLNIASSVVSSDYESYIQYLKYLWNLIQNSEKYSKLYTKEILAIGFDGDIKEKIYNALNYN